MENSTNSQSPVTGVVGAVGGILLCSYLALHWGVGDWWGNAWSRPLFLWGIVIIIFLVMGILDQWVFRGHWKEKHIRPAYHDTTWRILYSSLWRFTAIFLAILLARCIYLNHPLYSGNFYFPFRVLFFPYLLNAYVLLGLPYIVATLYWRGRLKAEFKDPALHILLWIKMLGRMIIGKSSQRHIFRNRRCKIVALGFLIELFYLPLMTVFLNNQFADFAASLNQVYGHQGYGDTSNALYYTAYHGIYLMDVLLAMGGYAVTLRWLDNKIQSVEPTFFGWFIALICYPPFDVVANTYITYGSSSGRWLGHWAELFILIRLLTLFFAAIYASATMMFGTRFSNLTNRGILTKGPYAIVRHPAYIAKNLSWWFEKIGMMDNPWNIVSLSLWNLIYATRAWTEERHLMKDPAYRAYCQRVKYRFIPGLF